MTMTKLREAAFLPRAALLEDLALLGMRVATGVFLVHGVWDNIADPERMSEFVRFMRAAGFAAPEFWAPFSVYTQFAAGALAFAGLLTRWGGAIITVTFLVALYVVHWDQSLREWWPALSLVVIGLLLLARGAGRYSLDHLVTQKAATKV